MEKWMLGRLLERDVWTMWAKVMELGLGCLENIDIALGGFGSNIVDVDLGVLDNIVLDGDCPLEDNDPVNSVIGSSISKWCGSIGKAVSVRKDDLIIFGQANKHQARLFKGILDGFCDFSGHRVNAQKSNIFYFKGVSEDLAKHLSKILGFCKVQNLSSYLGVPLIHDKGHLAQSVLLTIPSYFMQLMMILNGLCKKIKHLLGFNIVSNSNALWVRVLRLKYGVPNGLSKTISWGRCSFLWRSLSKVWPLVRENNLWSVGNGNMINCWQDPWIPNFGPLVNHITFHSNMEGECVLSEMIGSFRLGHQPDPFLSKVPLEKFERGYGIRKTRFGNSHGSFKVLKGLVKKDSRLATIKGVIRDRNERWILGYNRVLESYSSLDAELWDILDSLTIALDRGFVSMLIFSDKLEVYK
ncbi:hypothetical protein CXB51_020240 [Gossypium anomalum]|uniref:RNase H type-1 domain-containing protein n=1 Tax=Gossypium anomalum TaxID=47600 RepID=A0A8J5YQ11_9ROSI|nr:hypothetical protein CXB51_020240 [Gossypium anomalum]